MAVIYEIMHDYQDPYSGDWYYLTKLITKNFKKALAYAKENNYVIRKWVNEEATSLFHIDSDGRIEEEELKTL